MKKYLLLFAVFLSISTAYPQTYHWAKQLGGGTADVGRAVCTDASGNVISAGFFTGTMDANPGAGVANLVAPAGVNNAYISKLDSNGVFVWAKALSTLITGTSEIYSVATDATGNIYVTGSFSDTIDFDPDAGTLKINAVGKGIFVAKYTPAGALSWANPVTGLIDGAGYSITVDNSGNVITAGRFQGNTDFNPGAGSFTLNSGGGGLAMFVQKLDATGNFAWALSVNASGTDQATGVKTDASGNVYVCGSIAANNDFDFGAGNQVVYTKGGLDAFVAKYSSTGAYIWAKGMGSTGNDVAQNLGVDASGNVYVTGYFRNTFDANPDTAALAVNNLVSNGNEDIFVVKLNSAGVFGWAQQAGGTGIDVAHCLTIGNGPALYISGYFEATVDFNPGAAVASLTSFGLKDAFILSLNSAGSFNWAKQIGATGDDFAYGIGASAGQYTSIYTTGSFAGTANFNAPATANLTAAGGIDAFVHRLTYNCAPPTTPTVTSNLNSVCAGGAVNLYIATGLLNGSTGWQWYTDGCGATPIAMASSIVVNPVANTSYSVRAEGGCPVPGICGVKTISVTAAVTPTITMSASQTAVCAGTSVTFTATATNGGAGPTYVWRKNGVVISGATTLTYTTSTIANNDSFSVSMTSNATCASPALVSSAYVPITVASPSTPTINITTPQTTVCSGANVTFTATITNGGTTPVYQWKKNGTNIGGATSSTYSTTGLVNNDVITCQLTSNAACVSPAIVTSTGITMTVNNTVAPTITIALNQPVVCDGQNVSFTSAITNGGNAPAYQWKKNGSNLNGATTSTLWLVAVQSNDQITCVLTSNSACAVPATATSNTLTMSPSPTVAPSVSITASQTTVCAGGNVTFTATPVNGGASPSYQWKVNNVNAGTNSATFTTSTLPNNAVVWVVLTSNAPCAYPLTATSNVITMTVNPPATPAVSIAATQTTICAGNSVTFTATPVSGGNSPSYIWKLNGNTVGGSGATYTNATLANNDQVSCILHSTVSCPTINDVTSNTITIAVSSSVVPSVSITAPAYACTGAAFTLTASPVNGGGTPGYQWKKNGTNISGATSATYSTTTAVSGDVFSCVLTSSVSCAVPATATSNDITANVAPVVTPGITVYPSNNNICAGFTVNFTTQITNGGNAPVYQWKLNGTTLGGATAATYSTNTLQNGDVISCALESNATCATPASATSAGVTMLVNAPVAPAVSISATQTTICTGSSVTFTATATNGGNAPAYQWKLNGNNVGTNSATYTSSALADGDIITCQLTSSATCVTTSTATSNDITITVSGNVTPAVTISGSNSGNPVCSGQSVTFTAAPTNGGNTPTYQWKKNGTNISGATAATYTATGITNGDVFSCVLTSSVTCAAPNTATSNSVTITVSANVTPTITVVPSANNVCTGTAVTFSSTVSNGGNAPTYQWLLNGNLISGANAATYSSSAFVNNDQVTCRLVSNAGCVSPSTVVANAVTMVVNAPATVAAVVTATQSTICSGNTVTFTATPVNGGTAPTYQWRQNNADIPGETNSTFTTGNLANGDYISCDIVSNATCVVNALGSSNSITITVSSTVTPAITISADNNPICGGQVVVLTANPTNGGSTPAYQWKKNGTSISGATAIAYTATGIADGDVFSCVLTSSVSCAAPTTATSNDVTINVTPVVVPTATVSASQTTFCTGTTVNFDAVVTIAGSSPAYQWKVNGANIPSATSNTYITSQLADGDVVSVELTSDAVCATPATVTSAGVAVTVTTPLVASVSIGASQTTICSGTTVTFTATPVNGGSAPVYIWKVNGTTVSNGPDSTYATSALGSGDEVTCELNSSEGCLANVTALSNAIAITTTTTGTASVTVTASVSTICSGQEVQFTTSSIEGGSAPTYQWMKNAVAISGATQSTYSSSQLANNDAVSVEMTSNSTCVTQPVVNSTPVQMTVNALPDVTLTTTGSTIAVAQATTYQWIDCNSNAAISGATGNSYIATASGTYSVAVSNSAGCADTSACETVTVIGIEETTLPVIKVYPVPATDMLQVITGGYTWPVKASAVNAIGQIISLQYQQNTNGMVIDTKQLAAGVYTLHLSYSNYNRTARFIKAD